MNLIDRLLYCPKGGQFREYEGITTHLEPKDLSLYRRLLAPPLAVPAQPIVTLFVVDYIRVGGLLTRYQEWTVMLRCTLGHEEGWYALTMPVTKWLPKVGGRHVGFPKYVADQITYERRGETAIGAGRHKGVQQIVLEFSPGLTRPLAAWEKELVEDPSFIKGPQNFQLVPPGQGPRVFRLTLDHVVEARWSPCPGMVKVKVDPSESWAGLIPPDSIFPGTSNHFMGGVNIMFEEVAQ